MKLRPLGDVTLDMERYFDEMVIKHDLQLGEILNMIRGYLEIHHPECIEKYKDGTSPVFYYGHRDYK